MGKWSPDGHVFYCSGHGHKSQGWEFPIKISNATTPTPSPSSTVLASLPASEKRWERGKVRPVI